MSTRHFDSLPTELVRGILQDIDCFPRKERQATLHSLGLTSKLLRSHAQPLLLKRIYTSVGAGQDLLMLLVENNSSAALATVQAFIFDDAKLTNVIKYLKKFIKNATNLQEAYVNKQVVPLKAFFGSNITTLSLRNITMKLDGAVFALPELVRLSMYCCQIHNEGGIRTSLPKLKHLAFVRLTSNIYPQETAFLNRLAPNLVSFTAGLEMNTVLPPSILDHPSLLILYTTWSITPLSTSFQGVRHLLIQARGQFLQNWADKISTEEHQLKTLTFAWYGGGKRPDAYVTPLLAACKAQNVEVLWEHRPIQTTAVEAIETFFDVVPSSFISRSEARQSRT